MNCTSQPRSCMICVMWPAGKSSCLADVGAGDELDAFVASRSTRRSTTPLSSFMFGMPYIKQAADAVGPLVDGDRVAGLVELRGGGEARRAAADDGDLLAGALRGRLRRRSSLRRSRGR